MSRLEQISNLLLEEVAARFNSEPLDIQNLEFSESFAEILDRLVIMHIRMWKIEDAIGLATSNDEIADYKRKVDYLFKDRRPKLLKAINSFLDCYISKHHVKKFSEENVKLYKGFENK